MADFAVAVTGGPAGRTGERVIESESLTSGHRRRNRNHAHVLHATGDDEIHGAAHDGLGREMNRLLGRTTLAVNGDARDMLGKTSGEPACAGDTASLRSDRVNVAEYDVVDSIGVDTRALDEGSDAVSTNVSGVDLRQSASTATNGRTDSVNDVGVWSTHTRKPTSPPLFGTISPLCTDLRAVRDYLYRVAENGRGLDADNDR